MKKGSFERDFIKMKNQFKQIEEIAKHTKGNALWEHEVAVRKKLNELNDQMLQNINRHRSS